MILEQKRNFSSRIFRSVGTTKRDCSWLKNHSQKLQIINHKQCKFAYRESIFKHAFKNKGLIIEVTLSLPKKWQATLSYQGLNHLNKAVSAKQVMNTVIALRESKLPDPKKIANAGSFFKNPEVKKEQLLKIRKQFPHLPNYPQPNGSIKLAAGWLIDQVGLKGFKQNGVGIHYLQALVLVNFDSKNGQDLVDLALTVQQRVYQKFAIVLEPEVRMIKQYGEVDFTELSSNYSSLNNEL